MDDLGFPTEEMANFPTIINIEVYRGECPCNCIHCPVGKLNHNERKKREKGINLNLYKKIADEISVNRHSVLRIHSVGDPIVWENLGEAVRITNEKGINTWLFTSAVTTEKLILKDICEYTSIIEISVNSITPSDYFATKGIDAFDLVFENIKYLHEYITKNGKKTRLIASRVQSFDKNKDNDFVNFWKSSGYVDDAFIRTYHTYNDILPKMTLKTDLIHKPCLVHWARFNVSVDGYVIICFNELFKENLNKDIIIGDLNYHTIKEIWQGEKLNSIRIAELSGNYSDLEFKNFPCKNCYSCQPLFGNCQTSEYQIEQLR